MINIKNRILQSTLLVSASIYTFFNIMVNAIPFFLMPILTRYLTPEDYGMTAMFGVLLSILTPFIGLNIQGAITRVYYDDKRMELSSYIGNSILIICANTIIVGLIFSAFSNLLSNFSSIPKGVLGLAVIIATASYFISINLVLLQVRSKPVLYGLFQIGQVVLQSVLSILFVVYLNYNWQGRIYGNLTTVLVFGSISLIYLIKNKFVKFEINMDYIKHALKFGVPLVLHSLGGVLITSIDRIFITNLVGLEATGMYSVGYQIGAIINILTVSFNQAYVPWLYSNLNKKSEVINIKIVKFTYLYFIIIILLALTLSTIGPYFFTWFLGKKFHGSMIYIIWIAMGYAFHGMYLMVTNYIFYAQKTHYLSLVTLLSVILNIFFNYIFIKKNGAIGAAQATTMLYLVFFLLTWLLSSKVFKMPWLLSKKVKE